MNEDTKIYFNKQCMFVVCFVRISNFLGNMRGGDFNEEIDNSRKP
jgi:hypothetical protein